MLLPKKLIYLGMNLFFLAGWALTLIGLAVCQNRCSDENTASIYTFVNSRIEGDSCKRFYRLPWFILALNSVPVLLVAASMIKPQLARGATTAYFAVLAPLNILLAHAFYTMAETPASDTLAGDVVDGTDEDWYKVTLSGFAIMAGMCLLLLLGDSLLMSSEHEQHEREARGGKGTMQAAV